MVISDGLDVNRTAPPQLTRSEVVRDDEAERIGGELRDHEGTVAEVGLPVLELAAVEGPACG